MCADCFRQAQRERGRMMRVSEIAGAPCCPPCQHQAAPACHYRSVQGSRHGKGRALQIVLKKREKERRKRERETWRGEVVSRGQAEAKRDETGLCFSISPHAHLKFPQYC